MSETPTKKLLEMLRQGSAACAGQWGPEAADEIERLHALLRRVEVTASTGQWRDTTGLSLNSHPLLDDIRAALHHE